MPFDKSLDKQIYTGSAEFDTTKITVSVFSYNEGTPKLQISRENKKASGDFSFTKLGRLSKEEVEAILPLIEKAKDSL
ncbi:hypothetical protein HN681_01365 [archaeon]|jgi:hypothetical protein|nr:hypothetical protein [archaeon]MBT3730576.1 hypothetical protein [archaeon]MBT4669478.1 hypothetical protein [archaeon]MBT5030235.1 hypothetical protein [archaeon]MBT5287666.1 hypothetical protein [archaeon]